MRIKEAKYILELLNQILYEPRYSSSASHASGMSLREMYIKLQDRVNANVPAIIELIKNELES